MVIGKVPTNAGPGQVKDASARFSSAKWNELKDLRGPAPDDWPGFGFWFNYFWDESVTVPTLSNAEKQILVETFHGCLVKTGAAWQLRTDPLRLTEAKNRADIAADRNKRQRELTPRTQAAPKAANTTCPTCGEKLTNAAQLKFHMASKHS